MINAGAVYASGDLLTPAILQEVLTGPAKAEFAPASFRRLDGTPVPRLDEQVETAFALLCDLFDEVRDELPTMDRSTLRSRWVLELFGLLDWTPRYQPSHLRPHALDTATFAISHLGYDHPDAPPVHIEPTGGAELGLDARPEPRRPSPHDLVQSFLNLAPQTWGVVTDGRELRILRDFHHSRTKAFVGIDLVAVFASRDFEAFRALYRLAHVSRFVAADESEPVPLESLYARSQAAGISVGRSLHRSVRQAIELLAGGVVQQDPGLRSRLTDAGAARTFYGEVLQVVYRVLFILFAEQRGLLPGRDTLYAETYSLTRLRDLADDPAGTEGRRTDLYEGLKVTFRLMNQGSEALSIAPFNGHLFDADATPVMSAGTIANRTLLRAVHALTSVSVEGHRQHVAYGTIGVEELGAVYESLLDYTPRIAEGPVVSDTGATVPTGGLYLERVGDRELGSYYTPPDLVAFTLERSLDLLIAERLAIAPDAAAKEQTLLDLRAIDPACGSGAFLVGVIDRIALALADVRTAGAQPTDRQLAEARRDVLQRCVYGVDVDPFAVELCKVALWIHCAVADLPLTFLDHRIQCGNSLIGWALNEVPATIPFEAYQTAGQTPGDKATKAICASARKRNKEALDGQGDLLTGAMPRPDVRLDHPALWREEERVPADVQRKAAAYADYLDSTAMRLWQAAADLWTASFFWTADFGGEAPVTTSYAAALDRAERYRDGRLDQTSAEEWLARDLVVQAGRLAAELNAFHWPLRFPEIAERGGFDLVTGNPPWEQFENREQEWFSARAPDVAKLTGARRKAEIDALDRARPGLAAAWRFFESTNARLTSFARISGRFTPSGGKVNTYLLFTEMDATNLSHDGRAGVIVKSSLGIDLGGQAIFRPLVEAGRVAEFYDIVNGGRGQTVIFPTVAEVERFAVLAIGPERPAADLAASMMNWSIEEARTRSPVTVSAADLRTLNPVTRSLPSFREPEHWRIALRLQAVHSTLDFDQPSAEELQSGHRAGPMNPWGLRFATLFNSASDSVLFLRREDLEAEGWTLGADMIFRRGNESALPLYEGQLANRYDHRARTYAGYPVAKKYGKKPGIPLVSDVQKADPSYEIEPRYWMEEALAAGRLEEVVGANMVLAFRDVSRPWTDRRSAKATAARRCPATDKLPIFGIHSAVGFEFLGIFNSTAFDFLVRGHMPGSQVRLVWMLSQIAAPAPGLDPCIGENARKLSLTSHAIAHEFDAEPHPWDPEERYALDVETDALVGLAYGVTEAEYGVILDTFEVLARQEIAAHGTYRFKADCLAAYRRLA